MPRRAGGIFTESLLTSSRRMALSTFLVNLEITIVSTSLVSITDEFHDFSRSSWIVTSYLITYTGKNDYITWFLLDG